MEHTKKPLDYVSIQKYKACLINRIINFYEGVRLISCLLPVPDARCPVIRFLKAKYNVRTFTYRICRKFMCVINYGHKALEYSLWIMLILTAIGHSSHETNPRKVQGCVWNSSRSTSMYSPEFCYNKGFFSFLYNSLQSANVYCVRDASFMQKSI
uniref:Uncharacterized protein n=1 Tax=Ditylenchus dipsaci TaxID=166011 RepID=A0A915DWL7_9BILA